jgi:hypothetical protein
MKKILFYAFLFFAFACNREQSDPDLANRIIGDYKVTELKLNNVSISLSGISAKIQLVRLSATEVNMNLSTTANQQTDNENLGVVVLTEGGSNTVLLSQFSKQVGTAGNGNLSLNITEDGTNYILKAQK